MTLATCETLGQGLSTWLENASEQDKERLCSLLNCGVEVSTGLQGTGTEGDPLSLKLIEWLESASEEEIEALQEILNSPLHVTDGLTGAGTEEDPVRVKLSEEEGNALALRDDGLYYGTEAPPDTANLYVDPFTGDDEAAGTEEEPLATINEAFKRNRPNQPFNIHLKEAEIHYWHSSWGIKSNYEVRFQPYGPETEAVAENNPPGTAHRYRSAEAPRPVIKVIADRAASGTGNAALELWSATGGAQLQLNCITLDASDLFEGTEFEDVISGQAGVFGSVNTAANVFFRGVKVLTGDKGYVILMGSSSAVTLDAVLVDDSNGGNLIRGGAPSQLTILHHNAPGGEIPNSNGQLTWLGATQPEDLGQYTSNIINPIVSNLNTNKGIGL